MYPSAMCLLTWILILKRQIQKLNKKSFSKFAIVSKLNLTCLGKTQEFMGRYEEDRNCKERTEK